jgi:hypothetical protein
MKIRTIVLTLLLTLSLIAPVLLTQLVTAVDVPPTSNNEPWILWEAGGQAVATGLLYNPEFLKLRTENIIHSNTIVIIQGKDTYGQNIEAKVVLPPGTSSSKDFIFNDTHTNPPMPVAFARIDRIFQQNGTHCNSFEILTHPWPYQEFLGEYMNEYGFMIGENTHFDDLYGVGAKYLTVTGKHNPGMAYHPQATLSPNPIEPVNPDPLKVLINWWDEDHDLNIDDATEWPAPGGAKYETTLWFEGLDEAGYKYIRSVDIHVGDKIVEVPRTPTWSTLCKVWGGAKGEEYYIFTHPDDQAPLFEYFIRIDHLTIHPAAYDILANPDAPNDAGKTTITVALRDVDGNLVHANEDIILNFYTSAGRISPSNDVTMVKCQATTKVNLKADTNARTLKVVVDANVPEHPVAPGAPLSPAMNLMAWTELTFDGINSVLFTGSWPIHMLMNGYNDTKGVDHTMPAPFETWLPPELGGPQPTGIKLDGPLYEVMIPLYRGCNLISSPVYPMFGPNHYQIGQGIPMDLLFGMTSATDTIEAIWWYDAGIKQWFNYIPGVSNPGAFFRDGIGYWIKAEKPCTLELSGVAMENAPFVPAEYPVYHSWNLMGFTSITPLPTADYLESLATTAGPMTIASAVGPIWTYNAEFRIWTRNPATLYPTNAFWMNYKLGGTADLAP